MVTHSFTVVTYGEIMAEKTQEIEIDSDEEMGQADSDEVIPCADPDFHRKIWSMFPKPVDYAITLRRCNQPMNDYMKNCHERLLKLNAVKDKLTELAAEVHQLIYIERLGTEMAIPDGAKFHDSSNDDTN